MLRLSGKMFIEAITLKKAMETYKSKAIVAKHLKISRSTLYRKLQEYGIKYEE